MVNYMEIQDFVELPCISLLWYTWNDTENVLENCENVLEKVLEKYLNFFLETCTHHVDSSPISVPCGNTGFISTSPLLAHPGNIGLILVQYLPINYVYGNIGFDSGPLSKHWFDSGPVLAHYGSIGLIYGEKTDPKHQLGSFPQLL